MTWYYFIYTAIIYGVTYEIFKWTMSVMVKISINLLKKAQTPKPEPDLRPKQRFKEIEELKNL